MAACALLVAAIWAGPAAASVLYRCTAASGETAYVSHTTGYHDCVKIGEWHSPVAHAVPVAYKPKASTGETHPASVLPGKPPQPVSANPSVLKVTPLGDDGAVAVSHPQASHAWQPFPVVAMDTLASWVLPRVLGVELAPAGPAAPAPAESAIPANSASSGSPASSSGPRQHAVIAALPASATLDAPVTPRVPPRRGAVYRVVEKNGTVMYTNVASLAHGHQAKMLFTYIIECYACNMHSKVDWETVPLRLAAYGNDISAASKLTGVDAALLRAIIHAESGFNPRALSYKGAQGLMQLMPGTAFDLGVADAFDPAQNISGGARYLATLLHDFHGNVKLAAAAYNAGAGAVTKYGGVPPYAETQVYVKRVALLYQRYRKAMDERAGPTLAAATVTN